MDFYLSLASQNLLSAPVLFFALGFLATLAGGQIALPGGVGKMMALYLMLSIGFKGGASVGTHGLTAEVAMALAIGVLLSAAMPLLGHALLGAMTRLGPRDRAAIAAHYGSISIVTFVAGSDALIRLGIGFDGGMVAVAAAMEAPAILAALWLLLRHPAPDADPALAEHRQKTALRDVVLNVTIVILLGAFAIGAMTGQQGLQELTGFVIDPFRGVLCLFLLDLGAIAGGGIRRDWRLLSPGLLAFALVMPLIGAALALVPALALGLSVGNTALLVTLAASASYIAVPAAMRIAVPDARPEIYLGLSLGLTFPFNLIAGLPIYVYLAGLGG
ncbi:MAG: sodium-dependent bicarbonate transport family permease [Alphaproteobacteria bacterium]|nr:sodium-dependent bicarbonate transport family permease [Alphaproteobacteria bacterium]MBU1548674.1 sodium-dependent bicarbonate transport family permease [Alphaproteobacteria bacterium]MBU2335500.1 sodium-dependent bicarbonate transport family permease [Alphaproteobacteria bacterium]MBU2391105.1 sodium-dependent bicarbonate transport family permease [Alphaproteobacteria bacterium]